LLELLSKVLELFVQQGLEASKAQEKVDSNVSICAFVLVDLFLTQEYFLFTLCVRTFSGYWYIFQSGLFATSIGHYIDKNGKCSRDNQATSEELH